MYSSETPLVIISSADPPWQAAIYQTSITKIAIKREFQQMGKLTGLKYFLTEDSQMASPEI